MVAVANHHAALGGTASYELRGYAPLFGLMDSTVSVQAGGGVEIEGAYDLALVPQICENLSGPCSAAGRGSAWYGLSERAARTAEHTSELQSLMRLSYADFSLKKK